MVIKSDQTNKTCEGSDFRVELEYSNATYIRMCVCVCVCVHVYIHALHVYVCDLAAWHEAQE